MFLVNVLLLIAGPHYTTSDYWVIKKKVKLNYCHASFSPSCCSYKTQHAQLSIVDTQGCAVKRKRNPQIFRPTLLFSFQIMYFVLCWLRFSSLSLRASCLSFSPTHTHSQSQHHLSSHSNRHSKWSVSQSLSVDHTKQNTNRADPILARPRYSLQLQPWSYVLLQFYNNVIKKKMQCTCTGFV